MIPGITLADITKYPDIFQDTYWGSFPMGCTHRVSEIRIIENRNKFVEEYQIKGKSRVVCDLHNDYSFDHIELYRRHDGGLVLLNSPYVAGTNMPWSRASAKRWGTITYKKLYHPRAITYLTKFARLAEFNLYVREHKNRFCEAP